MWLVGGSNPLISTGNGRRYETILSDNPRITWYRINTYRKVLSSTLSRTESFFTLFDCVKWDYCDAQPSYHGLVVIDRWEGRAASQRNDSLYHLTSLCHPFSPRSDWLSDKSYTSFTDPHSYVDSLINVLYILHMNVTAECMMWVGQGGQRVVSII